MKKEKRIPKRLIAMRRNEIELLRSELFQVRSALLAAYRDFNSQIEPDLIEASIYEINSLQAKYSWVLRKIKKRSAEPIECFAPSKYSALGDVPTGELH